MTEKAVAPDPNAQPKAGPEGGDAQVDDIDAILDSYDKEPAPVEKPKPEAKRDDVAEVRKIRDELAAERTQKDVANIAGKIRGDLDTEVFDDRFMEAWVDAEARNDPRLRNAFAARHNDPKQFEKIVSGLGKQFQSKFSNLPDRKATDDRDAVAQAVRRASTTAPEQAEKSRDDVFKMTPAEFETHTREVGKQHRQGQK